MRLRRSIGLLALVIVVPAIAGAQEQADRGATVADSCAATPVLGDLPVGIRATSGEFPVWMRDNGGGRWAGGEAKVSTLWMVLRRLHGDLVVTGRRLDGPGHARFQREFQNATDSLVIAAADRQGVNPGTVSPRTMRQFSFHPSYVIYPAPGCWELTARFDTSVVTMVLLQRQP